MDMPVNISVKQKLLGVINIPWFFHAYHAAWLVAVLLAGYFGSWWIPVAAVAMIVFYGMKY